MEETVEKVEEKAVEKEEVVAEPVPMRFFGIATDGTKVNIVQNQLTMLELAKAAELLLNWTAGKLNESAS